MYPNTQLFIDGHWRDASDRRTLDVTNPATGDTIGTAAYASLADLDEALAAADRGFRVWRATSPFDRCKMLRAAAALLRERIDSIAHALTTEQGKPLAEAKAEIAISADVLDWSAEEGRRTYGRVIPARAAGVLQTVVREPVGPVAAFTPWNFPMSQIARKIAPALAVGCSVIVKAAEDTPASAAALVGALADAGLPAGAVNLVFGDPAAISAHLIPHPVIRKISFTGSVPVGKQLAALAGQHMKRATMELGGHSPVIVSDDVDLDEVAGTLAAAKFRNAGQVCIAPTRFIVQDRVYDAFVERFTARAEAMKVGDGLDPSSTMGPLITQRRRSAVEDLIQEARQAGAVVRTGGNRIGNTGNFLEPTVLADVTPAMRIMNEEPFGPVALVSRYGALEDAIGEANRLPYGLAAYGFSRSAKAAQAMASGIEAGMLTMNHIGLALPETPFGGVKDSGYGAEGGVEGMEPYLTSKFVTHLASL